VYQLNKVEYSAPERHEYFTQTHYSDYGLNRPNQSRVCWASSREARGVNHSVSGV